MIKNWLIRTKSNHILGPISKAKACELYQNSSVKPEDEFCSGNGYWFYVKEKDLIQKFLFGDEVQGFNPISEAQDTLVNVDHITSFINLNDIKSKMEEAKLPNTNDLDYPDMVSGSNKKK